MYTYEAVNLKGQAGAVIIALLASFIVLTNPFVTVSKADYIDSNSGPIVYNDRVCNLGDPNDHSTSATAFEISTSEQLWEITDCVSNSATIYFKLGDDIDVSQATTAPTNSPIGFSTSALAYSFSGVLDGNNKLISGISMSATSYGVGLFAYLHNATVSNLVISGSFSTSETAFSTSNASGALAIRADGALFLSSISNQAEVSGKWYVAGLVGYVYSDAIIENSQNSGAVSGSNDVGGLLGYVDRNLTLNSSFNTGTIFGSGRFVGGLVGYADVTATINSSHNSGTVSGTADEVGGLVGAVGQDISIISSHNTANIFGTGDHVGGLVGYTDRNANVKFSYNTGAVSGSSESGGLLGYVGTNANIDSSSNSGDVSGASYTGGLVGRVNSGNANITSSHNIGNVSGSSASGGLVGYAFVAEITSSYNIGAISGSVGLVAGLVGVAFGADIDFSYNTGTITAAADAAGGLVGTVFESNVNFSYNSGTVSGTADNVGGLVGYVENDANIDSSYNTGPVSGSDYVGGLVGHASVSKSISSSFNTGNVSGVDYVGGLVGYARDGSITSSHNMGNVSGSSFSGGLLGASYEADIDFSYNTGRVAAAFDAAGGLAGYVFGDTKINGSQNNGRVSGNARAGGLVGWVDFGDAYIENSFNTGSISASSEAGGLVGRARNASVTSSYNTGDVTGSSFVDGLIASPNSAPVTSFVYSSVASLGAATTPIGDMKLASTYVGFDFTTIWGFGTCTQNGGFPMLRVLAQVPTYYSAGCYTAPQNSTPTTTPPPTPAAAPAYSGPMIYDAQILRAGSEVTFTGRNLGSVTAAYIGPVEVSISSVTSQSLVLSVASSSDLGVFDLVLQSSFGTLTFQNGITVLGPETQIVAEATPGVEEIQKLTVGSFRGFIAIYTKGYEGQRLSAKVAGKWLVVESLDESFKGNDYSRTVRRTGSGYSIKVHLYIDREFVRVEDLITQ